MALTEVIKVTHACIETKNDNGEVSYFLKGKILRSLIKDTVSIFGTENVKEQIQSLKAGDEVLITGELNVKAGLNREKKPEPYVFIKCTYVKPINTAKLKEANKAKKDNKEKKESKDKK